MTTMSQAVETVLKTDAAGRIQMPPERREALLDEFERSGLSGAKFAKLAGVKYQTFAAWAARRRKQRGLTRGADDFGGPAVDRDLDRPQEGMFKTSQQALADVHKMMSERGP